MKIEGFRDSLREETDPVGMARSAILRYMRDRKMRAGHALNAKNFMMQVGRHMSPPDQDALQPAIEKLIAEGKLTEDMKLTDEGYNGLY